MQILHFETSLDAVSSRSDVISSIKILSLQRAYVSRALVRTQNKYSSTGPYTPLEMQRVVGDQDGKVDGVSGLRCRGLGLGFRV